jgi:hypothetical protein
MLKRLTSVTVLTLVLAACGGGAPPGPPPPPPFDPAGTYDLVINAQGFQMEGTLTFGGSAAAGYTGAIDTQMGGAALAAVVVDPATMTVTFHIAEVGANVSIVFEGDAFTGTMDGEMGEATLSGTKRPGG